MLCLTYGQGLTATLKFCFLTIILFLGSLSDGAVSRQRTLHGVLETRESGSCGCTSPSEQAEFSSAGHLLPLSMPVRSSTSHRQPSFYQGNHQFKKQGKMRAGEFDLAYTLLAVLLPCPGSPAAPARGFLLRCNNYLKMLKFLAASGDTSRSQGIHCNMQFPIPHPEPVWLKLVWFCVSFLPWKLQPCHPSDTNREWNTEQAAQA